MSDLSHSFLVIETPRAGRWNHRYLIPAHCPLTEAMLTQFMQNQGQFAHYYLSIDRQVTQTRTGRPAQEKIFLLNIDKLKMGDTLSIELILKDLLIKQVAELINSEQNPMDWDLLAAKNLYIIREELNKWFDQYLSILNIPSLPLQNVLDIGKNNEEPLPMKTGVSTKWWQHFFKKK